MFVMGIGIYFWMMWSIVLAEQHLPSAVPIMQPVFINRKGITGFSGKYADFQNRGVYD